MAPCKMDGCLHPELKGGQHHCPGCKMMVHNLCHQQLSGGLEGGPFFCGVDKCNDEDDDVEPENLKRKENSRECGTLSSRRGSGGVGDISGTGEKRHRFCNAVSCLAPGKMMDMRCGTCSAACHGVCVANTIALQGCRACLDTSAPSSAQRGLAGGHAGKSNVHDSQEEGAGSNPSPDPGDESCNPKEQESDGVGDNVQPHGGTRSDDVVQEHGIAGRIQSRRRDASAVCNRPRGSPSVASPSRLLKHEVDNFTRVYKELLTSQLSKNATANALRQERQSMLDLASRTVNKVVEDHIKKPFSSFEKALKGLLTKAEKTFTKGTVAPTTGTEGTGDRVQQRAKRRKFNGATHTEDLEGMENARRDSNLVNKLSSAVLEGVTKGQCNTRNTQGRTSPSDDTAMMHMLESVDARLRHLEPMHAQLRRLESMANDTHTLHHLTAKVNSLMSLKTQIASVEHRLDDMASDVKVLKCRMSGGSQQPGKAGNLARGMDDASGCGPYPPFASDHPLRATGTTGDAAREGVGRQGWRSTTARHPKPIVRRELVDRGSFSPYDEHTMEDMGSDAMEPHAVDGATLSFKNTTPMSARQLRRPSNGEDDIPWTVYDRERNPMGLTEDEYFSPPKRY